MLQQLHIENIAIIESADITFSPGFNVLTGETGAGKSIVIDAISAVLGERTYRDIIRTGADSAFVSAIFSGVGNSPWFEENHVPYDVSGEVEIQREISPDGKNTCRVNGRAVSVGLLKLLGSSLVGIHGQHDSRQLFDEANHLLYLDNFAENSELINNYVNLYGQMNEVKKQLESMNMDESEKLRRIEMLKYQIKELQRAKLTPGEDEDLLARRKLLQNAETLVESVDSAYEALSGGDDFDGAVTLLDTACRELSPVLGVSDELSSLSERLTDLRYLAEDIADELRGIRGSFDFSENELDEVEGRLDTLYKLKRKYGNSVEEMLEYLEKATAELDDIELSEETVAKLEKELKLRRRMAVEAAEELSKSRKDAAMTLRERILDELRQLDMPNLQFQTEFVKGPLGPNGFDSAGFMMSANVGEALKPLSKVASGGELARIILAMKNVLADRDEIPTMIFDEVDSGVSGRAAQKVAAKLKSVARNKQVLCVTHLPQIAAPADFHFSIEKAQSGGRTYTKVIPLDFEARKVELAQLIGGDIITDATLKSAEELIISS